MEYISNSLKIVFGNWKYVALASISGFFLLLASAIAANLSLISELNLLQKILITFDLIKGIPVSNGLAFVISLPFMVVLFGINIAFLVFSFNNMRALSGGVTAGGLVAGLLGTGCSACGSALLGVFGLSGALVVLPFQGAFIAPLSVALMLVSLHLSAKSISSSCNVKVRQ